MALSRRHALALALLGSVAHAQPPTELPPFDVPKPAAAAPAGAVPGNRANFEYDPSRFYLPDSLPARPPQPLPPGETPGRFWVGMDYLHWTLKSDNLPAPLPALIGDKLGGGFRGGLNLTAGYWLDQDHAWGLTGDFQYLRSASRSADIGAATPLAPLVQGDENRIGSSSEFLAAGAGFMWNLSRTDAFSLDLTAGYRFLRFDESLRVNATKYPNDPLALYLPGSSTRTFDEVNARNQVHGGTIGLNGEYRYGQFCLSGGGRIGVGAVLESVEPQGTTTIYGFNQPIDSTLNGAVVTHAQTQRFRSTDLAVIPEGDLKLAWQFSDHLRASFGYHFLYVNKVARPAAQFVGTPLVLAPVRTDDFWAQGFSLGLEYRR